MATLGEVPKLAKTYLLPLLREARKVRLRVIALPQDDQVESLDIKGQGAARANLTYVRLGKVAIAHAKALAPDVAAWVASQPRPCLVEDQPAIVPSLGALPSGPVPTAISPAQHQDDRELLFRCWDAPIEVGHETIARDVELPPAATAIQQWIDGRSDTFKLRDFQRAGIGELKGLNAESILAVLQVLEAAGVGQLWNDGQGWRFRLL